MFSVFRRVTSVYRDSLELAVLLDVQAAAQLAVQRIVQGAEIVGAWSTDGYEHEDSKSVRGDKFIGCAFDEDNQPDESEGRAQKWVEQIKGEGIAMLAVAGAGAKKKNRAPAPRMEMPLAKVVATVGPASEAMFGLAESI